MQATKPRFTYDPPGDLWRPFDDKEPMSALVIIYTRSGFIIAADGRMTSDVEGDNSKDNDEIQKIFRVGSGGNALVYSFIGIVSDQNMKVSLVDEAASIAANLPPARFFNFGQYVTSFCERLTKEIDKIQELDGHFQIGPQNELPNGRSLITQFFLVGNFQRKPVWAIATISHSNQQDIRFELEYRPIRPGEMYARGSSAIPHLAIGGDARFAEYRNDLIRPYGNSFEDAAAFAKAFIEICSHPQAIKEDPICKIIGGHVHIAQITPDGFKWLIPPKS